MSNDMGKIKEEFLKETGVISFLNSFEELDPYLQNTLKNQYIIYSMIDTYINDKSKRFDKNELINLADSYKRMIDISINLVLDFIDALDKLEEIEDILEKDIELKKAYEETINRQKEIILMNLANSFKLILKDIFLDTIVKSNKYTDILTFYQSKGHLDNPYKATKMAVDEIYELINGGHDAEKD